MASNISEFGRTQNIEMQKRHTVSTVMSNLMSLPKILVELYLNVLIVTLKNELNIIFAVVKMKGEALRNSDSSSLLHLSEYYKQKPLIELIPGMSVFDIYAKHSSYNINED